MVTAQHLECCFAPTSVAPNLTKTDPQQLQTSSGFSELDDLLGGGFPPHGVVEMESIGSIGELRLLAPYLKATQTNGQILTTRHVD